MAILTAVPTNLAEAYNPIMVTVSDEGDELDELTLYIYYPDGTKSAITRVVTERNGGANYAHFDISRILASKFTDGSIRSVSSSYEPAPDVYVDGRCVVYYILATISNYEPDDDAPYLAAVNGVRQWNEPQDIAFANQILSHEWRNTRYLEDYNNLSDINHGKIRMYDGYPTLVAFRNKNATFSINQNPYSDDIDVHWAMLELSDFYGSGWDYIDIALGYPLIVKPIPTCVPEHPYYVRWINDLGGWEYNMFSYNRNETLLLSERTTIQRPQGSATSQSMLSANPSSSISIIEEGLSTLEFQRLCGILKSPVVEHYNESTEVWDSLLVGEDSIAIFEPSTTQQTITIELVEPRPLLQF